MVKQVAPLCGKRGLKFGTARLVDRLCLLHPIWGAWIEINYADKLSEEIHKLKANESDSLALKLTFIKFILAFQFFRQNPCGQVIGLSLVFHGKDAPTLIGGSKPPPTTYHRERVKEGRGDFHPIPPLHVLGMVNPHQAHVSHCHTSHRIQKFIT
jgi:hypothetical protein